MVFLCDFSSLETSPSHRDTSHSSSTQSVKVITLFPGDCDMSCLISYIFGPLTQPQGPYKERAGRRVLDVAREDSPRGWDGGVRTEWE